MQNVEKERKEKLIDNRIEVTVQLQMEQMQTLVAIVNRQFEAWFEGTRSHIHMAADIVTVGLLILTICLSGMLKERWYKFGLRITIQKY